LFTSQSAIKNLNALPIYTNHCQGTNCSAKLGLNITVMQQLPIYWT